MVNEIQIWKIFNEKLKDKAEPRIGEPEPYTDTKATQGDNKETMTAIKKVAGSKLGKIALY